MISTGLSYPAVRKLIVIALLLAISACGGEGGGGNNQNDNDDTGGDGNPGDNPGGSFNESCGGYSDFLKGVNFACWYPGCFEEDDLGASLDALRSIGANTLTIVPTWYQVTTTSSNIYQDASKSPTLDEIKNLIETARAKGFSFILKPHVDTISGGWRGQINPGNLNAWHSSYQAFILTFAELAEETGIEVLSIGTELKTRSGDTAFWRGLIGGVREIYSGKLTYSANWDEYQSVQFWDLLDYVSIDFYFPLTDKTDATQAEMEAGLEPIRATLEAFSAAHDKPFIFTEIGFTDRDGTNTCPYCYGEGGSLDYQEQADAYAAVLSTFSGEEWLEGMEWWRWDPRITGSVPENGYLIYGKPAADILSSFWNEGECALPDGSGESGSGTGSGSSGSGGSTAREYPPITGIDGTISFITFGDWGRHGTMGQPAVAAGIADYCGTNDCQFIVALGDNFYDNGVTSVTDAHWQDSYHDVFDSLGLPFYPTFGNHDINHIDRNLDWSEPQDQMQAQIDYTHIDPTGNWRFPAENYSVCLPTGSSPCLVEIFLFNSDWGRFHHDEAHEWLTNTVSTSTATWKILAMHHPIISNGLGHGDWNQGSSELRLLTDLICEYGISFAISGHDHDFAYLKSSVNGCMVDQFVFGGGGGGNLRDVNAADPRVVGGATGKFYSFGAVHVSEDQIVIRAYNAEEGRVIYETTFSR